MEPTVNPTNPSAEAVPQGHPMSVVLNPTPEATKQGDAIDGKGASTLPQSSVPTVVDQTSQQPLGPLPIVQATHGQAVSTDDSPLVAADDEVMEKEWVDRAKRIVAQTKDDPFKQENEVSKLQADYIKKRYGKEIKLTSD